MGVDQLKAKIRDVPDWPVEGVIFLDTMTLLADREALKKTIDLMADWVRSRRSPTSSWWRGEGIPHRLAVAHSLGCGFVPARRPGEAAGDDRAEYALQYGTNALELQADAFEGEHSAIFIDDDVLATGGTSKAMAGLVEQLGGEVIGMAFIIELDFLKGREQISDYDVFSLIHY